MTNLSRTIRFASYRIPGDVDVLYHEERVVPLEPQAVRVLRYLAERPGRVIPKGELLDNVWPDVFTSDGVLKKAISLVRRALGDDAAQPAFVETHHGRGYCFIGPGVPETAPAPPAGLPRRTTRFIGRREEIGELTAKLDSARLLTLVGLGGMGKTRLSLELAATVADRYPDGVRFVELAPLADEASVVQAVVAAVAPRGGQRGSLEAVASALGESRILLILDNCEHVVEGCARVADALLRAGPGPRVVATSREALGVEGELVWRMPPLAPDEAAALFADRAHQTDAAAETVTALCARLEGNALAIELAAARARVLAIDQILARLDDRLDLLATADRTGPARHRTLRATIDWSYDLLTDEEQALFRTLSVFSGGFDLEAAETVFDEMRSLWSGEWAREQSGGSRASRKPLTLDLLTQLVDKSLVVADTRGRAARYGMLESVRRYAREGLREAGEEDAALSRHVVWALGLAERAEPELAGPGQVVWLDRLSADLANLRAAWEASAEAGDAESCARFAKALRVFWSTRGLWNEASACIGRALEGVDALPPKLRVGALRTAAASALRTGDPKTGVALAEAALAAVEELDDELEVASMLRIFGLAVAECGELDRADALLAQSLGVFRAHDRAADVARVTGSLAWVALLRGDLAQATMLYEESLALCRQTGLPRTTSVALHNLAEIAWQAGDLERAETLMAEALAMARKADDRQLLARSLQIFGCVARELGDPARAVACLREAVTIFRELGEEDYVALAIESAAVARATESPETAVRVAAAVEVYRGLVGSTYEALRRGFDEALERARAALGPAAADRARREGRLLAIDDAMRSAFE